MKWLLDTCVLSEFSKPAPEPKVVSWLGRQANEDLAMSVLALGELERGIQRLADGAKRQRLSSWLATEVVVRFEDRLLPVDAGVAREWANLCVLAENKGRALAAVDGLIAATALAHHLALVTRDDADFRAMGLHLHNPWKE